MKIPIVMAAFGTTTGAMKTYSFINQICKKHFPDNPIFWAFSSRMVKDKSNEIHKTNMQNPSQILKKLENKGYKWAVVQSLHLMCGHEFYRLVAEVDTCSIRASMGLPLLSHPPDYHDIVNALKETFPKRDNEAVVFVGHGTDHPSWCTYVALDHIFGKNGNRDIYVGVVEEGYPEMESVVKEVADAGYKHVTLIPLLIVAGVHFESDMSANEDSWKSAFEEKGITVNLENQGLGFKEKIVEIFCRHIEEAMDVIPGGKA